jgi:TATA-box binding protein (TBP) (component of TFIID and TFIIIB)
MEITKELLKKLSKVTSINITEDQAIEIVNIVTDANGIKLDLSKSLMNLKVNLKTGKVEEKEGSNYLKSLLGE